MRGWIRYVGCCAAAFGVFMTPLESRATLFFNDPFGDEPSTMFIGTDPNWGDTQWVGWEKYPTGECEWVQIGTGSSLPEYVRIFGLGGDDWMFSVPTGGVTFCGYYITPPITGSQGIGLEGGDGNDLLALHGELDWLNYISGGAGHDDIRSYATDWAFPPTMYGDSGNDLIYAAVSMSGSILIGDSDDDCLQLTGSSSFNANCNGGNDRWAGPGSLPSGCETAVSSCY
jgi:hypothetical protein